MEKFLEIPLTLKPKALALPKKSALLLKYTWPYLAIISAHAIWGANFIVAKLTLEEIPVMSLAFLRFLLATVLLLPFLISDKKNWQIQKADLPRLFLVGIFMVTLNISFFYLGISRTSATEAAVLTMIIPVISVLLGWWFLKEHVYVINIGGILLGLLGTAAVIGVPDLFLGGHLGPERIFGNLLIILASVVWVIGAVLSKKLASQYSTLTITMSIFLVGVLTFFIPALNEYRLNPTWPSQVTFLGVFGLLFITLLSSISAYFLFEWGLGKLGVIKADLFQYLEPVVATSLAVLVLEEKLSPTFLVGSILIALGVYWTTVAKESHKHHKAHRT